jgi:PTH1 family peptidyl-tRNA hydrolase
MRLVVGLGNPGNRYQNNRHNIGFSVLDAFAADTGQQFKKQKLYWEIQYRDVLLIKPTTFMNLSGNAVTSAKTRHSIDEVLVVVDDIYLPLGEIRLRHRGGSGGHNGLRSVTDSLGSGEFKRMRIGVDAPASSELRDFVLSNFSVEECSILNQTYAFTTELLRCYLDADFDSMLSEFSKRKQSYSEQIAVQDL